MVWVWVPVRGECVREHSLDVKGVAVLCVTPIVSSTYHVFILTRCVDGSPLHCHCHLCVSTFLVFIQFADMVCLPPPQWSSTGPGLEPGIHSKCLPPPYMGKVHQGVNCVTFIAKFVYFY